MEATTQAEALAKLKNQDFMGEIIAERISEKCGEPDGTQEWADKAIEKFNLYVNWTMGK